MKINNIFKIIGICSIIAPIPVTLFFLKPTYNLLLSNNAIYYDINYIFLIGIEIVNMITIHIFIKKEK